MAKLIRLSEHRAKQGFVHFNRTELTLLLNLYARRVAGGDWRDYAIDHGPDRAVFTIYRHTLDQPLFTIVKSGVGAKDYMVSSGGHQLARSTSLADALAVIERGPRSPA